MSSTSTSIYWTEAEWRVIQFYAEVARNPRRLFCHGRRGLGARAAGAYAARHLRGKATCSEILLARRGSAA